MEPKQEYRFDSPNREEWLAGIQNIRETYCAPNWIQVILSEKINHSMAFNQYFERTYFEGKDLTGLNNCVAELFQNILDHAQAHGNAFFAIYYHEERKEIEIAICDFGVGIPYTLREQYPDSRKALQRSLLPGVSARTHKHNRGYGLDNIVSTMTSKDSMRIISNDAFLSKSQNIEKVDPLPYNFKGTLIDFTISTDSFDELEIIDELNFG